MHCILVILLLTSAFVLAEQINNNSKVFGFPVLNSNATDLDANKVSQLSAVSCVDKDLEYAVNYAVSKYRGNMDGIARYLLDVATRKGGYWLAQANLISRVRQGAEWQSLTNGPLFTNRDAYGCYYHDNTIFVYIVKIL